jgi:hypothetical protein
MYDAASEEDGRQPAIESKRNERLETTMCNYWLIRGQPHTLSITSASRVV